MAIWKNPRTIFYMGMGQYLYIFSGMNIHKSQLFCGSLGTRVLTHPHMGIGIDPKIIDLNGVFFQQTRSMMTRMVNFSSPKTESVQET